MSFHSRFFVPALAAIGVAASGAALAQSKTWKFDDQTSPGYCAQSGAGGTNNLGNTWSCAQQPSGTTLNLEVTGWSTTGSNFTAAAVKQNGTGYGFGVGNATEGGINASSSNADHSMDSANGNGTDLLMLKFLSGPEALSQVTLGWSGADGDFQVLRWKGTAAPATMTGYTAATALTAGWELVSTVSGAANIDTPDVAYGVNSGKLTSSYWLISAFNSSFGGSTGDTTADSLKVLGVAAAGSSVPEPVSLALVAVALGGAAVGRRRAVKRG